MAKYSNKNSQPSKSGQYSNHGESKGSHHRVIKDSAKIGTISPNDARTAAKSIKERRSSKS